MNRRPARTLNCLLRAKAVLSLRAFLKLFFFTLIHIIIEQGRLFKIQAVLSIERLNDVLNCTSLC